MAMMSTIDGGPKPGRNDDKFKLGRFLDFDLKTSGNSTHCRMLVFKRAVECKTKEPSWMFMFPPGTPIIPAASFLLRGNIEATWRQSQHRQFTVTRVTGVARRSMLFVS